MIVLILASLISSADCNEYMSSNVQVEDGIKYVYWTKKIDGECVLDGLWTEYFIDTGNIRSRGKYEKNLKQGHWFWNRQSGMRQMQGGFKDNNEEGYWIFFHRNGKRFMEGSYSDGIQVGQWMMFDEDEDIYSRTMWDKGHIEGEIVYYHKNGKKKMLGTLRNGKRAGKWTWWDEDGRIEQEENYP
jgi:antitoxin component YwqK of YwqJK toxin-antitoxin module